MRSTIASPHLSYAQLVRRYQCTEALHRERLTHHFLKLTVYAPCSALLCRARRTVPMTAPHVSATVTLHAMNSAGFLGARLRRLSTISV